MEEKKLPHDHGQSMERELEQMPSVDDFQTVADIFKMCIRDRSLLWTCPFRHRF